MSAHDTRGELAAALQDCPALRDFPAIALDAVLPGDAVPVKARLDIARLPPRRLALDVPMPEHDPVLRAG